jgi:LacI family transcriptional regulator
MRMKSHGNNYDMKKKGSELSGVKEIARRANVSIGTVDRVLHNRTGVSAKTREKVNRIIIELDYQPNLLARRLASRKIIHFATLIPKVSEETSFWEAPLRGIEQAELEIRQYNVKIEKYFFDQNDSVSFIKQAQKILKKKPDGILMAPSFIAEAIDVTNKCKDLGIPYVFMDSNIPNQNSLSYIGPHLYRSGYLAANLVSYIVDEADRILVINISKEIDNHHHLLRKEEGFRGYFKDHKKNNSIVKIDISHIDYNTIEKEISRMLSKFKDIKLVFVTNSKVSIVARYLQKLNKKTILIGYDFLEENIDLLNEGSIDFLICQKPGEQAYKGIMTLYKHLVMALPVEEIVFMPIDIITKENYSYYRN